MQNLILILLSFFPESNKICQCYWQTRTVCGSIQENNTVVLGEVFAAHIDDPHFEQILSVKVIEDLNNSVNADTIIVHGGSGANCSDYVLGTIGDTILFSLRGGFSQGEYDIYSCGQTYLMYQNDTLLGTISPYVEAMAFVDFLDHYQSCLEEPQYVFSEGVIRSWATNNGIGNLSLEINGFTVDTEDNGGYSIDYMIIDESNSRLGPVEANSLDSISRGVTTLDIIRIKKHVVGTELMTNPYQLIAADVDGNQMISTLDMISIQKVILGISTEFPIGKSWEFIANNHEFLEPDNPWLESYSLSAYYIIQDWDNFLPNINFKAIKIGDVNGSI